MEHFDRPCHECRGVGELTEWRITCCVCNRTVYTAAPKGAPAPLACEYDTQQVHTTCAMCKQPVFIFAPVGMTGPMMCHDCRLKVDP